jgi:hypothetical protein
MHCGCSGSVHSGTRAETGGNATRPQASLKQEAALLREPVGGPAGDPVAQRHTQPNKGLQATANSVCSSLAVRRASGMEECGNTLGYTGTR